MPNTEGKSKDVFGVGLILWVAVLLRLCTSYYPYSGANKPPMYGDYEAQRHWQEITLNLPISQWYSNSSKNDLQYWGLDYPPLTAYHSLLVAYVANWHDPKSVELHQSRGYESTEHKYFMRLSVLVVDLLVFIPAVLHFSFCTLPVLRQQDKKPCKKSYLTLMSLLCYPGIILIDYGHFQYNCVSLGFFIASASLVLQDCIMLGSSLFVLGLNYKQMELYHALPFFFYILGCSLKKKSLMSSLYLLIGVSLTVVATFAVIWAPFLTNAQVLTDAVLRLFPFKRGIFEDKVANIWCAINVAYKLKNNISNSQLALICLATTACAVLPSSIDLLLRASREKFVLALINSSLAFFLCSFQVHEKSILLVAIPVLLQSHRDPFCCLWFAIVSVFSMLPLLIKDELLVAYLALSCLFALMLAGSEPSIFRSKRPYANALFGLSLAGIAAISACSIWLTAPSKYPDLFSLLTSVYSCAHFVGFLVYFNYGQMRLSGADKDKLE